MGVVRPSFWLKTIACLVLLALPGLVLAQEADTLPPTSGIAFPQEGASYSQGNWGEMGGTVQDDSSGVASVYVSIQRDADGGWWCDTNSCSGAAGWQSQSEGETLNETGLNSQANAWSYSKIAESDLKPAAGSAGYVLRSHGLDNAGNWENTNVVHFYFLADTTPPQASWTNPTAGATVSGVINLEVGATDTISGVAGVSFQYRRQDGVDTFHNIASDTVSPYLVGWDTTGLTLDTYLLRATATDKAGNAAAVERSVDVAAVVSNQTGSTPTFGQITITWFTDRPTSSRVVYGPVSQPVLDLSHPNYGYALSSTTADVSPKTLTHTITLSGLVDTTVYYWRTVSAGSPTAIGPEGSNKTFSPAGAGGGSEAGGAAAPPPAVAKAATAVAFPTPPVVMLTIATPTPTPKIQSLPSPSPSPQVAGTATVRWWSWWWLLLLLGVGVVVYIKT